MDKLIKIIDPIEKKIIKKELENAILICKTKRAGRLVYSLTSNNCPNIMNEIGRLREITFRTAGNNSNQDKDIDENDIKQNSYKQLIVWEPEAEEIIAGYRYAMLEDLNPEQNSKQNSNQQLLKTKFASEGYFQFSEHFKTKYCPQAIDLGRAFIQPQYQVKNNYHKGMFALDNIWEGLGKLISSRDIKYIFGRLVLFPNFNKQVRTQILFYLYHHFFTKNKLVSTQKPSFIFKENDNSLFTKKNYKENYTLLAQYAKSKQVTLPPLIKSYMRISPSMKVFATTINPSFGEAEEIFIMLKTEDFYPHIKKHYF